MKPIIVVNLKTYMEGSGSRAVYIAQLAQKVSKEEGVEVAVAVQAPDIFKVTSITEAVVYSQHVDCVGFGANTGHVHPETVRAAGAEGTLLNHAECRLSQEELGKAVSACREAGLKVIACTDSIEQAMELAKSRPEFIAFEDPSLIGTLQSVSRLKPESVREFASLLEGSGVTPLCGAGIANGQDLRAARELGMAGGIVATAVMKAEDPEKVLRELAQGLKK